MPQRTVKSIKQLIIFPLIIASSPMCLRAVADSFFMLIFLRAALCICYNTVKGGNMDQENAARFLRSYNCIEARLKSLYSVRPTQNFTDLVKRCSDMNITVRRYAGELIDYGKLRNAIVHQAAGTGETVIAIPCDEVVDNIEYIERQICRPPKVTDAFKVKKIVTAKADEPLLRAVEEFAANRQKTVIVYDHGTMAGVINSYALYGLIAKVASEGGDLTKYLTTATCGDAIDAREMDNYCLMNKYATVLDVFTEFEKRRLVAVIITENGVLGEKVISMVTPADFPRINKFLENYNVKPF